MSTKHRSGLLHSVSRAVASLHVKALLAIKIKYKQLRVNEGMSKFFSAICFTFRLDSCFITSRISSYIRQFVISLHCMGLRYLFKTDAIFHGLYIIFS